MAFLENRKLAWPLLVLVIIVSIVGLGGMKLKSLHDEAVSVFYDGTDTGLSVRHSMDAYLDRAASRAAALAEEAKLILGSGEETDRVLALSEAVSEESHASSRADAYGELISEVESLYTAILAEEDDPTDARIAYNDFKSAVNLIQNDAYSGLARAYNRAADSFPAGILAGLFGLHDLTAFGG